MNRARGLMATLLLVLATVALAACSVATNDERREVGQALGSSPAEPFADNAPIHAPRSAEMFRIGAVDQALVGGGPPTSTPPSPPQPATPATITSDKSTYLTGDFANATFSSLPGGPKDWIALAPANAPFTTYQARVYTDGSKAGTVPFSLQGVAGSFVFRAFINDTYTLAAESAAFTVTQPSATVQLVLPGPIDANVSGVMVSFANMPSTTGAWLGVYRLDADNASYLARKNLYGQVSGNTGITNLQALAGGTPYEVRAFFDESGVLRAKTSSTFYFTTDVRTRNATYAPTEPIVVDWTRGTGDATDWVSIAYAGSAPSAYLARKYTDGVVTGSTSFPALAAGSYVVRFYYRNELTIRTERAFQIVAPPPPPPPPANPIVCTRTMSFWANMAGCEPFETVTQVEPGDRKVYWSGTKICINSPWLGEVMLLTSWMDPKPACLETWTSPNWQGSISIDAIGVARANITAGRQYAPPGEGLQAGCTITRVTCTGEEPAGP